MSDAAIQALSDIALGVVANALTSLLAYVGGQIGQSARQRPLIASLKGDQSLQRLLALALAQAARATPAPSDASNTLDRLKRFIVSPDVEALMRQAYASRFERGTNRLAQLRAEFDASARLYLSGPHSMDPEALTALFNALLEACHRTLQSAIDGGVLAAHEAQSVFRHQVILDHLASIEQNVLFQTRHSELGLDAIERYVTQFRQQAAVRHGFLVPPHLDAARKIPIDNLFVAPRFLRMTRGDPHADSLTMEAFLAAAYREVVLGTPGAGKSTFTQKVAYELARSSEPTETLPSPSVPFLVILRDYGAARKARGTSIVDFITTLSNSHYQLPPPAGAIEYLLLKGRAFVIFDGLDELLDTSYRLEIGTDIEAFCRLYATVPVVITSREVGYNQAPLNEERFPVARIAPFNEEQIKEYVDKWFAVEADGLAAEVWVSKRHAFLVESAIVPDLRSNPLMLALLCNIYRGENYIPRNRPDVYEKCAVMLFERWDKGRGIDVTLPFEALVRPAMMHLAHWIFTNAQLQAGVTEESLVAEVTSYLCPRRFEDPDEARAAARSFVDFCRGRAWVFSDIGMTPDGTPLYQFTHRTFLEYFTACHLVRTNASAQRLADVLLERIARKEWDVVAQLALQILNRNVDGAGDELLEVVAAHAAAGSSDEQWNLISFTIRCLEFMVPRPRITRNLSRRAIEISMELATEVMVTGRAVRDADEVLGGLLMVANENRRLVADVILEQVKIGIRGSPNMQAVATEIGTCLPILIPDLRGSVEQRRFWGSITDVFLDECWAEIKGLVLDRMVTSIVCWWEDKVSIEEVLGAHGPDGLFRPGEMLTSAGRLVAIAESLASRIVWSYTKPRVQRDLETLGARFLATAPPWAEASDSGVGVPRWLGEREMEWAADDPLVSGDFLFGAFAVLGTLVELDSRQGEHDTLEIILTKGGLPKHAPLVLLGPILASRAAKRQGGNVELSMDVKRLFSAEQRQVVMGWMSNEIHFVRPRQEKV